jgi:nicotinamidase-related amidase
VPAKNDDLHGNVPDTCDVALLLIDVINDLEFEGGEALLAQALPAAERIAALERQARAAGVPVIYVNDNFGKWQSDLGKLLRHCLKGGVRGEPIARLLAPGPDDYFVLKPKHSGFFSTTLDTLLAYLKVRTLVLTGLTTNVCVLFTANDAYMRDFNLVVPCDCVAAIDPADSAHALAQMARVLHADTRPSTALRFEDLKRAARGTPPAAGAEPQAHDLPRTRAAG